jgi:hypothetical protein
VIALVSHSSKLGDLQRGALSRAAFSPCGWASGAPSHPAAHADAAGDRRSLGRRISSTVSRVIGAEEVLHIVSEGMSFLKELHYFHSRDVAR